MTLATLPKRAGASLVAVEDDIGATLRDIRVAAGLSQTRLIEAIRDVAPRLPGVDAASVAHWERNRRVPGMAQLHAFMQVCNATNEQVYNVVERYSVRALVYEVLMLRWRAEGLDAAQARQSWNTYAPLVPTAPARRR